MMVTGNEDHHALTVAGAWLSALVEVCPAGAADERIRHVRRRFGADYWQRGTGPS